MLCGTPPAVENAHLIGRRRSHYDIHATVRYQCSEGFFQRHIPTIRCRADGSWERPRIICAKCECQTKKKKKTYRGAGIKILIHLLISSVCEARRSHRYRRHRHSLHREHRPHRRHRDAHKAREDAQSYY